MSTARHHAEWLSLVEISGPFLSMPVLMRVFPQGLIAHDPDVQRSLKMAHEEWEQNQQAKRPDRALHWAWVKFVLNEVLELPDEVLAEGQGVPQPLRMTVPEHAEILRPDLVVKNPSGRSDADKARLLVQVYAPGQKLERPVVGKTWKASPDTRMMELLHATNTRLGLVITYLIFNLPLAVWLLMRYFEDIPTEIEDAALADGCSKLQAFRLVLLPLALPGIIATFLFCLIFSWNEYLFALILTRANSETLPILLASFVAHKGVAWGPLAASGLIATFPILLCVVVFQKHLVRVMTMGMLKG